MMTNESPIEDRKRLADVVRRACVEAAREGYAQAAASGLCDEGAFEAALGAIQMLDLNPIIQATRQ